ncbi:helix-turn-helix transcriptional regulator [Clostridium oryzae]|uniref:HTH domain protein n=1 Tax=Clostridium oryzae TaxID=1450648 RepID=A0A1V4I9F7_9CLOT|nr:YafY family protein [Clostridium oryzae]OPJ56631.1 HTH domain protein [Clostridium oryzae]
MKIDRLFGITVYLLNNEVVTARQLVQKFEVSVRTIQRDMETLCKAQIPIMSVAGVSGGYSIIPDYKIKNQYTSKEDYRYILMALKGLNSSYSNKNLENTLNKYMSLIKNEDERVFLDYSVSKEDGKVQTNRELLEEIISENKVASFNYRDAEQKQSSKIVQPLAVYYKWYAWYMLGYDINKNDYRIYKIARMSELKLSDRVCFKQHDDIENIIKNQEQEYSNTCETIEVWCRKDCKEILQEYFPNEVMNKDKEGNYMLYLHVPARERLWQALLLSLGDGVKIIKPLLYKEKLIETAKKFLSNYDIQ